MSYFGLMTSFPCVAIATRAELIALPAGSQMIQQIVQVYPGSDKFLHETIQIARRTSARA